MSLQILLADDHKIFSDSLHLLLSSLDGFKVVGQVTDGKQAIAFLEKFPVDLVLSDLHMPFMDGVEMILHIRQHFPKVQILVLTMAEDRNHILEALQAGAAGYILKSAGKEELVKALLTVTNGQSYLSEKVLQELYRKSAPTVETADVLPLLTDREIEVIKLIVQEQSSNQIAERLYISLNTVETHRKNLYKKLNIKNSLGLLKFALKHGLVE